MRQHVTVKEKSRLPETTLANPWDPRLPERPLTVGSGAEERCS